MRYTRKTNRWKTKTNKYTTKFSDEQQRKT